MLDVSRNDLVAGVAGSGTMGRGIVQVLAQCGVLTLGFAAQPCAAAKAMAMRRARSTSPASSDSERATCTASAASGSSLAAAAVRGETRKGAASSEARSSAGPAAARRRTDRRTAAPGPRVRSLRRASLTPGVLDPCQGLQQGDSRKSRSQRSPTGPPSSERPRTPPAMTTPRGHDSRPSQDVLQAENTDNLLTY